MIKEAIAKLADNKDLTYEEVVECMNDIMSGETSEAAIGAYLMALRIKGETIEEVSGSAQGMRDNGVSLGYDGDLLEIVGTGGDKAGTFNVSTTSAFVAAGAGCKVAKHGNRGVSSKSGAADVLEALGANINLEPEQAEKVLDDCGFTFLFAQKYHTSMKYVGPVRAKLGIRTVFNILGPLTNPAGANMNVIGVYDEKLVEPMAEVLKNLGAERGMVVFGMDTIDEITPSAKTKVCEFDHGEMKTYYLDPTEYGISICDKKDLVGGDKDENAKITEGILKGEITGPKRDAVILNSAAAIYTFKGDISYKDAIKIANESIDSGAAYDTLQKYVAATNSF